MAFQRPLLISSVKDLKLNYDNDGVQAFFADLLKELDKRPVGGLLIKQFTDGVAGLYSSQLQTDCITLNSDAAFYNPKTKYLTLTTEGVLTLLHEGSHFMHLAVDNGKFVAPCYKECAPCSLETGIEKVDPKTKRQYRFMCEVEAGYRAVCAAIMYDTNLEYLVSGDNLRNLLAYKKQYDQWLTNISSIISQTDSHAIQNTLNELSLNICAKAMDGHKFLDAEDIDQFAVTPSAKELVAIHLLHDLVSNI